MSSGSGRDSNAGPLAIQRMTTQEFGNTLSENHTTRPLEPMFGGTLEYNIKLANSSTNSNSIEKKTEREREGEFTVNQAILSSSILFNSVLRQVDYLLYPNRLIKQTN